VNFIGHNIFSKEHISRFGIGRNDNIRLYHAMHVARRIIFLTYEGAELLDLAGPSAVFSSANHLSGRKLYEIIVASVMPGKTPQSCGIALYTLPISELNFAPNDTVLIVGADSRPLAAAMADVELTRQLSAAAAKAERFGSICTGVFALAAAGLVSNKMVATHWAAAAQLSHWFPDVNCDADALYVTDGKLWTSAGVTTGIDMALAMLEHDHGGLLKASVARRLVIYSHRPGHQSQFSELLAAQAKEGERFAGLINWLGASTGVAVSIERMAEHVGMSPRTFHRQFVATFGQTPGKLFEALRLDAARRLLEGNAPVADVALQTGFHSESAFRSAFKAQYGVTPTLYRQTWSAT
jgi:transcriptional regulator GlxA family with amidase domain